MFVAVLYVYEDKGHKKRTSFCASAVRKQLHIGPNAALKWRVQDSTLPVDPVKAFRGSGKKGSVKQLLKDRRRDRQKEGTSLK
jgi:hypothetical protein